MNFILKCTGALTFELFSYCRLMIVSLTSGAHSGKKRGSDTC